MRKIVLTILVLAIMVFANVAFAEETTKWSDFSVEVDGVTYQLPVEMSLMAADGWILEDAEEVIEPNQYMGSYIQKGEEELYVSVINLGIDDKVATDCLIGSIQVDDYDVENMEIMSIAGFKLGDSMEDLLAAWGAATRTYDGSTRSTLTYEKDTYEYVEIAYDPSVNVINELKSRCFTTPAGYNDAAYAVEVEVPACVTDYVAPESVGDDLLAFTFKLNGVAYQLPAPVAAFAENDWELEGSARNPKLAAHDSQSGWDLRNGGQSLERVRIENCSATANIPENGMVIELRASGYTPVDIELPLGITLASKTADIEKALESVEHEKEVNGDFIYYEIGESSFNCVSIVVNSADDMITSIEICCWGE